MSDETVELRALQPEDVDELFQDVLREIEVVDLFGKIDVYRGLRSRDEYLAEQIAGGERLLALDDRSLESLYRSECGVEQWREIKQRAGELPISEFIRVSIDLGVKIMNHISERMVRLN